MAFYAVNKWNLTGDEFIAGFGHATVEEAEAAGRANVALYEDQKFVRVVEAAHANAAKAFCVTPMSDRVDAYNAKLAARRVARKTRR